MIIDGGLDICKWFGDVPALRLPNNCCAAPMFTVETIFFLRIKTKGRCTLEDHVPAIAVSSPARGKWRWQSSFSGSITNRFLCLSDQLSVIFTIHIKISTNPLLRPYEARLWAHLVHANAKRVMFIVWEGGAATETFWSEKCSFLSL